jgi:hypothetical protein
MNEISSVIDISVALIGSFSLFNSAVSSSAIFTISADSESEQIIDLCFCENR